MSIFDGTLHGSPADMRADSIRDRFFSAFAVALGLSVIAGYLSFLRELPSGDFHAEWGALFFFCCAALFVAAALPRRFAVNPALLLLPGVLAALLVFQALLGKYGAWQTPAFWFGYLVLAVLALVVGQGIRAAGLAAEAVNRITWALLLAALLNTFAQIAQAAYRAPDFAPFVLPLLNCRPYGNIGQSNHAATLAWLGIGSALYLHGSRRLPSPFALPSIALLLVSAALSASRMSWLLLAVTAAAVVLLPAWPGGHRRKRLLTGAMLVGGFVLATVGSVGVFEGLGPTCVNGLDRLVGSHDAGIAVRLGFWQQAVAVWLTSPWIGVGAYGFGPTVYAIASPDKHHVLETYAHNIVLQLLAEFGVIGAGALVLAVVLLTGWLVRARRQLTAPDAVLLLLLAIIATHSMLEFPLWYAHFLIPFCLALGLLMRPEWAGRATALHLRGPVMATAAALLTVAGLLWHDYRNLDRLAWIEIYRGRMSAVPTKEVRARIEEVLADVRLFRVRAEFFAALSEPITREDLETKVAATDALLRRELFPPLIVRRIALAVLAGDEESARWHLTRLLIFFPGSAQDLAAHLKSFAEKQPDDFAVLGPMVDEELARMRTLQTR